MKSTKKVSVRQLQHNLADYLTLAQTTPLSITKHGKPHVVILNPDDYNLVEKKPVNESNKDLTSFPFIGMHKDKKTWKNKSSQEIADNLKTQAWYGK